MKSVWKSFAHRANSIVFVIVAALFLLPSVVRSQAIDNCSSGVVDSENGIEQTVCIYGDGSSWLTASGEVDAELTVMSNFNTWAAGVGLNTLLDEGNTLEWASGDQQDIDDNDSSVTEEGSITPDPGATYYVWTYYDELICQGGDFSCPGDGGGSWSDGNPGLTALATMPVGYQGYIDPKFIIVGVTYAPPGPQSSVTYSNSQGMGTSVSLSHSVSSGTSYSVSITTSAGIPGWKGGATAGTSNSSTQTTKDSQSTTLNWSVTDQIKTYGTPTAVVSGAFTSPVESDYDIVYVWLNPVETLTLSDQGVVWNGYGYDADDQNGMDIVGIALGYLNGDFGPMPSQLSYSLSRQWAAGQTYPVGESAALDSTDLAAIAQSDPFSDSSYGPNEIGYNPPTPTTSDKRFTISQCNGQNSEPFEQADPSDNPPSVTCTLSYSDMTNGETSYTTSSTTTYSIDKAFNGSGFLASLSVDFKSSSTTTTTTEVDNSVSSSQSSSATLNIVGLPCNNTIAYQGPCVPVYPGPPQFPIQFMIYQDNVYGTFMFAPVDYF